MKLCKNCGDEHDSKFKHCLKCRKVWRRYGLKYLPEHGNARRAAELEVENERLRKKIEEYKKVVEFVLKKHKPKFAAAVYRER